MKHANLFSHGAGMMHPNVLLPAENAQEQELSTQQVRQLASLPSVSDNSEVARFPVGRDCTPCGMRQQLGSIRSSQALPFVFTN